MNVSKTLSGIAALQRDDTAIIFREMEFTWGNLNISANSISAYLRKTGIVPGDNLAVILPNCPEFALIYFASAKTGTIFTPVDTRLGLVEINSILRDTRAKICFVHPDLPFAGKLSPSVRIMDITGEEFTSLIGNPGISPDPCQEINPDDTALYLHTSGTTGKPKIVELTYSNLDCFPDAMQNCVVLKEKEVA